MKDNIYIIKIEHRRGMFYYNAGLIGHEYVFFLRDAYRFRSKERCAEIQEELAASDPGIERITVLSVDKNMRRNHE